MIEPDEAQGPAQFFLQRMAQNNPKIDLSRPVPISLLTGEIERMRGGGDRGGGPPPTAPQSDEPQLLVPDFSLETELIPPAGFSAVAEGDFFNVKVEERDIREAEDRMRRYDRNRDGKLSTEELRQGRWSDDPMQYDRNRDGQLTVNELAVRYANRRVAEEARRSSWGDRGDSERSRGWGRGGGDDGWRRSDDQEKKAPREERFGDAKSYRLTAAKTSESTAGLPSFFTSKDANGDGQVMMSEFSSSWDSGVLAEFLKWDLNSDGVITAHECLLALEAGQRVSTSEPTSQSASSTSTSSNSESGSGGAVDPVMLDWAKRQIAKYDQNNDGELTAAEWDKMLIKPIGADANGDGILTVEEYARFRAKR